MKGVILTLLITSTLIFSINNTVALTPKTRVIETEISGSTSFTLAKTAIEIRVVVEKESIRTGPYARYAQKLLGVVAPLSDRDIYKIKSAELGAVDTEANNLNRAKGEEPKIFSHTNDGADFSKAQPDRMSAFAGGLEELAKEAVNKIFSLRKRRFDLITGETGENVFGAGLRAAIEEMDRLENQYLELFLGKRSVSSEVKTFYVIPTKERVNFVAFRFSPNEGALPSSDLTGSIISLNIAPSGDEPQIPANFNPKKQALHQIAAWSGCTLIDDSNKEIASAIMPIYQYGGVLALTK